MYYLYILTLDIYFWYLVIVSFIHVNSLGLMTVEDLQEGAVYNWMGFGEYGKAEECGAFASLFNTHRAFSLPTDLENVDSTSTIESAQSTYMGILLTVTILAAYFMALLTWLLIVQTKNLS